MPGMGPAVRLQLPGAPSSCRKLQRRGEDARTLYPWRRAPTLGRVRRAWVIPPISVSENHKRLPFPLVQIKSDKQQPGSVIYSIQGPGVDEEPRGVFSIDNSTGKLSLPDSRSPGGWWPHAPPVELPSATACAPLSLLRLVGVVLKGPTVLAPIPAAAARDCPGKGVIPILQRDERGFHLTFHMYREIKYTSRGAKSGYRKREQDLSTRESMIHSHLKCSCELPGGHSKRGSVVAALPARRKQVPLGGGGCVCSALSPPYAAPHMFQSVFPAGHRFPAPCPFCPCVSYRKLGPQCSPCSLLDQLRAFALDLGGSTLEEPTDLEIVVVDQNDNRPVFRQEVFTGHVLEGAAPGTYVTRAEATDADDPETDNAALRFSILEQGGPQLFSIDPYTGEIRTVQVGLDREVVAVYNLTLQVADMSGEGLTATASALITLEDVNDNAPEFTRDEFFVEATEAVSAVDVGRLAVEDRDLPGSPNWVARFTILEGDPDRQFTIRTDPKTNEGVLSVVKVSGLHALPPAGVSLPPPSWGRWVSSHPWTPVWTLCVLRKSRGRGWSQEGQELGLQARATGNRAERGQPHEPVCYFQPLPPDMCDLHAQLQTHHRYDLRVAVQSEGPLQATAPWAERGQARVSVQVRDVNEAPVFQENPLRTSLAEGAAPGTPVATFSARDPDTQQLQRLSYSKDYDPEDWLQVDGATGQVQTQRVLSPASPFLKDGWYRAIILAQDDASPPSTATGTLSIEILEVNDHAPELSPPWGSLCSAPDQGSGLLLGAMDEDLPPHGAPFHFQLSPRIPELARNWSLSQVNVSHARLRLRHQVQEGLHRLSLLLRDSGQPPQQREQALNVTVCRCGPDGACLPGAAALRVGGAGLSLGALVIVLASVILLLCECPAPADPAPAWPAASSQAAPGRCPRTKRQLVTDVAESPRAVPPQDAYDMDQLRHPAELVALSTPLGRPPLRRDAPFGRAHPQAARTLPTSPSDIADFINEGLEAADSDPSVPPYDTALIFDYEGDGSEAWTLSSILSSLGDGDQDYSCLWDWGPRFARLADLYGPP
uniref:Cadherin-15 n=1 Tax=Camelus bactrianus TaxID=9837 RepID=A0A9W3FL94_CAMBA|nr:cadherin-15 [Camelus bactrianus]